MSDLFKFIFSILEFLFLFLFLFLFWIGATNRSLVCAFQFMWRNKSEPLLYDPEPELTIRRRRAHQRLVAAMAGNGGGGPIPNPEEEARIAALVEEGIALRLQEQQ